MNANIVRVWVVSASGEVKTAETSLPIDLAIPAGMKPPGVNEPCKVFWLLSEKPFQILGRERER